MEGVGNHIKGLAVILSGVLLGALGCGGEGPGLSLGLSHQEGGTVKLRACGTRSPDDLELAAVEREVDRRLGMSNASRAWRRPARDGLTTVGVYFHVITAGGGAAGDVTRRLRDQVAVLNRGYSGGEDPTAADTGLRFQMIGFDVTDNDQWFYNCYASEKEMKRALYYASPAEAQNPSVLHIYTCYGGAYLGWAYLPWSVVGTSNAFLDGVVLDYESLPGGNLIYESSNEPDGIINYSGGDSGTHEVGHWLGLLHTFDGGCNKGDSVADTNAEKKPAFYCAPRDTCTGPKYPGLDPINNYMDYTDDDCLSLFTSGQGTRMQAMWTTYRAL